MWDGDSIEEIFFEFFLFCLPIIWVVGMSFLFERFSNKKRIQEKTSRNIKIQKNRVRFSDYVSVPIYKLEKIGVDNLVSLQEELYDVFENFQMEYYTLNFSKLPALCTDHYLKTLLPKIKRLKKNQDKIQSYEVRENFKLNRTTIYYCNENSYLQTVSAVFDISFSQYVKEKNGNILGGNPYKLQRAAFDVTFQRNTEEKESYKKCLNCGAPIKSHYVACEYCLTELNNPYKWRIKSIINKIAEDNYIDYYEN